MSGVKPRILLCWAYHRKHFVNFFQPFESEFEFIYLNWVSREMEIGSFTDCRKIYFLDYKNVQELVADIKPVKVIFMGIENLGLLLNNYCKSIGIPTFYLQHGVFHPYEAYVEEEALERKKIKSIASVKQYIQVDPATRNRFLLHSFSPRLLGAYLAIFQIILLTKVLRSKQKALYHTKYRSRLADSYIVFTKACSTLLAVRDGVPDRRFIEIGNPEADAILNGMESEHTPEIENPYFLLIDDPLAETVDSNGLYPVEVIKDYHRKLNQYALDKGKKLVIKLHPDNYTSAWLLQDHNIIYARASNMSNLIKFSTAVFGGLSTLLIPALSVKPCCLFRHNKKYALHGFLESIDYCKVLDYFTFRETEIEFNEQLRADQKQAFIKTFLYKDDRQSMGRIGKILNATGT